MAMMDTTPEVIPTMTAVGRDIGDGVEEDDDGMMGCDWGVLSRRRDSPGNGYLDVCGAWTGWDGTV
jgi:hypothetical protein